MRQAKKERWRQYSSVLIPFSLKQRHDKTAKQHFLQHTGFQSGNYRSDYDKDAFTGRGQMRFCFAYDQKSSDNKDR